MWNNLDLEKEIDYINGLFESQNLNAINSMKEKVLTNIQYFKDKIWSIININENTIDYESISLDEKENFVNNLILLEYINKIRFKLIDLLHSN